MYSTDVDLINLVPNISSWAVQGSASASGMFAAHRAWANAYIDNKLKGKTATPVPTTGNDLLATGLCEAEALLTAYRLIKRNKTDYNGPESFQYINSFKKDAEEILGQIYFPASASTPTTLGVFAGTGGITVSSYATTYTAEWKAECTSAGDSNTAVFTISKNTGKGFEYYGGYDLSEGRFPTENYSETVIVITGSFHLADTYTWRTYKPYKMTDAPGIITIPIGRG